MDEGEEENKDFFFFFGSIATVFNPWMINTDI